MRNKQPKSQKKPSTQSALKMIQDNALKGHAIAYYCALYLLRALLGDITFPDLIVSDPLFFPAYAFLIEKIHQKECTPDIQKALSPSEKTGLSKSRFPYPAKSLSLLARQGNPHAFQTLLADAEKDNTEAQGQLNEVIYHLSNQLSHPIRPQHAEPYITQFLQRQRLMHLRSFPYAQSALHSGCFS